jgi:hypothetical protein
MKKHDLWKLISHKLVALSFVLTFFVGVEGLEGHPVDREVKQSGKYRSQIVAHRYFKPSTSFDVSTIDRIAATRGPELAALVAGIGYYRPDSRRQRTQSAEQQSARSSRRQNWRNPDPRRVGQVGVVESRAHWPGRQKRLDFDVVILAHARHLGRCKISLIVNEGCSSVSLA